MDSITQVLTGMKTGMTSSPDSSQTNKDKCKFCGAPPSGYLVDMALGGIHYRRFPIVCSCEQAQLEKAERTRRLHQEQKEAEERDRNHRMKLLFDRSLIPERWRTRTFEHYEVTSQNDVAYRQAKEYAGSFAVGHNMGLIFTGTVGTGKTHLSAAIALKLLESEYTVVFGTVTTLLSQLRNTYNNDKQNEQEIFNRLVKCQLLILDDLGKEKVSDWVEQTVYELINTRYENNRPLIITTNMTLSNIRDKYQNTGEAIVSRIIEMCRGVKMNGADWRKKAML